MIKLSENLSTAFASVKAQGIYFEQSINVSACTAQELLLVHTGDYSRRL